MKLEWSLSARRNVTAADLFSLSWTGTRGTSRTRLLRHRPRIAPPAGRATPAGVPGCPPPAFPSLEAKLNAIHLQTCALSQAVLPLRVGGDRPTSREVYDRTAPAS